LFDVCLHPPSRSSNSVIDCAWRSDLGRFSYITWLLLLSLRCCCYNIIIIIVIIIRCSRRAHDREHIISNTSMYVYIYNRPERRDLPIKFFVLNFFFHQLYIVIGPDISRRSWYTSVYTLARPFSAYYNVFNTRIMYFNIIFMRTVQLSYTAALCTNIYKSATIRDVRFYRIILII